MECKKSQTFEKVHQATLGKEVKRCPIGMAGPAFKPLAVFNTPSSSVTEYEEMVGGDTAKVTFCLAGTKTC
jgi:hypothetical protein